MSKIEHYTEKILELENCSDDNQVLHIKVDKIYEDFISDISNGLIPSSQIIEISTLIKEKVIDREWKCKFWYA